MLVLSRKLGEEIVIGDDIRVKVVAVHGNQVKLGIGAPRWLPVWRGELVRDEVANPVSTAVARQTSEVFKTSEV